MILINYKTYEESSGDNALSLTAKIERGAEGRRVPVIIAVQAFDLKEIVQSTSLPVWVQNIDPITFGAHTGMTLAEEAVNLGASGTLINHSENKYGDTGKLQYAISHAQNIGLAVLVFASSLEELEQVLEFKPNYASYEPPEFIGSTTTSVATAQPEIIEKAATLCKKHGIPLIVGAGIHGEMDVRTSIERGATGIAVATDVVKSPDPEKSIKALLSGFN